MENVTSLMSDCSDDELLEFVRDNNKYEDVAVLAALQELGKRQQLSEEATQLKSFLLQKLNITDENAAVIDPQIPLFSEWTIFGFSLFFSSLFGAILLSYNLRKIGKSKKIIFPILFGLTYSIAGMLLQTGIPNMIISLVYSLVGAIVMKEFFWKLYIGKSVIYTKKNNLVPILVAIGLFAFLLIVMMKNGGTLPQALKN